MVYYTILLYMWYIYKGICGVMFTRESSYVLLCYVNVFSMCWGINGCINMPEVIQSRD